MMRTATLLLAGWGIAAAVVSSPAAAAAPDCTEIAPGTTKCANSGSVQIRTTPPPIGPFIRYGCTQGFTSYCVLPMPGAGVAVGP